MQYRPLHSWDVSPEEARQIQRELAPQVRQEPLGLQTVQTVAGADISMEAAARLPDTPVTAGFVVLRMPELTVLERAGVRTVTRFPYVPGLLSFREMPPLLEAWSRLEQRPDALLADGHGLAHPRRFGLACHLGLVLDLPTVGVAKSLLVGTHDPVPEAVGAWTPITHRGEVIGAALRSRAGVSPIFVSVGHRIDLPSAIALVLACGGKTRVPETTRYAHAFVNDLRRNPDAPEQTFPELPKSNS